VTNSVTRAKIKRRGAALDEDLKWHISPVLDERIPDFAPLLRLKGKALIGPTQVRFTPTRESLARQMARLRHKAD
jgi:hypothetical protein